MVSSTKMSRLAKTVITQFYGKEVLFHRDFTICPDAQSLGFVLEVRLHGTKCGTSGEIR